MCVCVCLGQLTGLWLQVHGILSLCDKEPWFPGWGYFCFLKKGLSPPTLGVTSMSLIRMLGNLLLSSGTQGTSV